MHEVQGKLSPGGLITSTKEFARTFESTIVKKLLSWGATSVDKSLNQPALPHAVIVLNALNATGLASDDEWDVSTATSRAMENIREAISRNPHLRQHTEAMRDTGRKIETTQDLLECYYASVSVIRIPNGHQPRLLARQIERFHELLEQKCLESFESKSRVRMLATAEQLQTYLHSAFKHFSQNLNQPFNFIKEALKHRPIPQNFSGYLVDLADLISRHSVIGLSPERVTTAQILTSMTPMIASCIMLDMARQRLPGTFR